MSNFSNLPPQECLFRALAHELQYKQNLATLLNVNLDYEYALCLGLYELAFLSPLTGSGEVEGKLKIF